MIIPIITGPTASGKSNIAYLAALECKNVEIISADAFQVYKHLNIGTAKVSKEELKNVTHHLIDIMEPDECYNAGIFVEHTETLIEEILNRGNIPVIAGGTGLYIKSLVDGIFNCPDIDENVRSELKKDLDNLGIKAMYEKLQSIDPDYAAIISNNDPARTIRALEVYNGLGITLTEAHVKYSRQAKYKYFTTILETDRNILYDNINKRTVKMFEEGWVNEVKSILDMGYTPDIPSFRAIGYKAIADLILNGGDEELVKTNIAKETRHFAKRQLTWFRHRENIIKYNNKKTLLNNLIDYIRGTREAL